MSSWRWVCLMLASHSTAAWVTPIACDRISIRHDSDLRHDSSRQIVSRVSPLRGVSEDETVGDNGENEHPTVVASDEESPPLPSKKKTAPLSDPSTMTTQELMSAIGTSPRRIALSFLSATAIALAGNFLGVTSNLLTLVPETTVEATGLDTYFPRGDYKRIRGKEYTFVIPKEWVADTALELAKAQRRAKALDYTAKQSAGSGVLPDAAFGPPGRLNPQGVSVNGDTNVSVIVSKVVAGFSLRGTLGSPENAAEFLLKNSFAPEGSGRVGTLLQAQDDLERNVYQIEYSIDRGDRGVPLRVISVIAAPLDGETLITLTLVSPEGDWRGDNASKLQRVASSFHLRT